MAEEPMSSSYADGLSHYENKGKLGLKEIFDSAEDVKQKVDQLATWICDSQHVVFHTGAGISTSAGIPDFRGPQGVWTLESQGLKPTVNISFNDAVPTKTHMALAKLLQQGVVQYVISQNIDGLHLRSGVPRTRMSELHGNMFTEECSHCERLFVRTTATTSVGQKCLGRPCPSVRTGSRPCRGKLHDTILDWEANLPEKELRMAEWHSRLADLSVTLGTTLQILPSANLPLQAKKRDGRVVICNLQPTKHHHKGDLVIHAYVDEVMEQLMQRLCLDIPSYSSDKDPTVLARERSVEWTISAAHMNMTRKLHDQLPKPAVKKRKSKSQTQGNHQKLSKSEINVDKKPGEIEKCEPSEINVDVKPCQTEIKVESAVDDLQRA